MRKGYKKYPHCTIDGCTKPNKGKGLCAMHWERERVKDPKARMQKNQNSARHRSKDRERFNRKNREYYWASIEQRRAYRRLRSYLPNPRWTQLKSSIPKRSHKLLMSKEEFIEWASNPVNQICTYCGTTQLGSGHGVDRINPEYEYSLDNIAACCRDCNIAKAEMSDLQFKDWITKVYFYLNRETDESK